ncbi:leucine-rich repeat protein [Treponema pectinovorum]|uniref:leucine-rich repeat protein n=1 Tax=Treponema pectinovorum TaxID=164 RepID=UPI0011F18892|nr:leucine-rich repeat protein [Treponema pectinovorum]
MKKKLVLVALIIVTVFSVFAENSASDFSYELSDDVESIIITGFKNNQKVYNIPATIEDIPVIAVKTEFLGFNGIDEILIKIPEGVKEFSLKQIYSRGIPFSHISIDKLPTTIEKCTILSKENRKSPSNLYITLKGSLKELNNLTEIYTEYVDFEEKSIIIRSNWAKNEGYLGAPENYNFKKSTIQEAVFEEGCEIIGGFGWCPNLKKIILPTSARSLAGDGFCFCKQLSEVVIPESLERIAFGYGGQQFDGTSIPLKMQVKLKKIGYSGSFGN